MSDCKNPRPVASCQKLIKLATVSGECPTFDVCLPFGSRLYTEGGCMNYDPPQDVPPDGVYNRITLKNGCIVGVGREATLPVYTQAPCAIEGEDCHEGGGGGGGAPSDLVQCNLYQLAADGRPFVNVHVKGGDGVTVTGCGSRANPITISVARGEGGGEGGDTDIDIDENTKIMGSSMIDVRKSTTADGLYVISHKELKKTDMTTINGMTFDTAGHLIDYNPGAIADDCLCIKQILDPNGGIVNVENNILKLPAGSVEVVSGTPNTIRVSPNANKSKYTVSYIGDNQGSSAISKIPTHVKRTSGGETTFRALSYSGKAVEFYKQQNLDLDVVSGYGPRYATFLSESAGPVEIEFIATGSLHGSTDMRIYIDGTVMNPEPVVASASGTTVEARFCILDLPAGTHTMYVKPDENSNTLFQFQDLKVTPIKLVELRPQ